MKISLLFIICILFTNCKREEASCLDPISKYTLSGKLTFNNKSWFADNWHVIKNNNEIELLFNKCIDEKIAYSLRIWSLKLNDTTYFGYDDNQGFIRLSDAAPQTQSCDMITDSIESGYAFVSTTDSISYNVLINGNIKSFKDLGWPKLPCITPDGLADSIQIDMNVFFKAK